MIMCGALSVKNCVINYLKYTQEQADILRGIVEQAKAKHPLDNALDIACWSKKAKIVESKNANHSEPNHTWGSNATDIPSSSSLVMIECVDLLSGSCDTNLYTISLDDMLKTSLICLLSKASKAKSWLWHRRLSHLNFGTLNKLAKDGLARAKDTNQEKLYLLHMDLYGPMRVASINGKSLGPGLHSLNPATSNSGLGPNPVSQQPCIPPKRDDWDRLFQPMFDEYFNPPSISITPDAPSTSIPSTQEQEHSPNISQGFEESPKTLTFRDDPLHESLHKELPSQGSSSNVRQIHTPFKHLGKWTKDHPIANVIGDPSCFVSMRKKLQTDAMWCYFDSFLTTVKPKNFKQALTELSWIDAMQE
ncbi:integrase, catalytic region, zinc finger, CCHC-type containing protein [Tanacetum coccineum]